MEKVVKESFDDAKELLMFDEENGRKERELRRDGGCFTSFSCFSSPDMSSSTSVPVPSMARMPLRMGGIMYSC